MQSRSILVIQQKTRAYWHRIQPKVKSIAIKATFLFLLFILFSQQEISFHIHIGNAQSQDNFTEKIVEEHAQANLVGSSKKWWQRLIGSNGNNDLNLANVATATGAVLTESEKERAAQFSNLGFILNPDYAQKHNIPANIIAYKKQKCLMYIQSYAKTAQEEAELFGIPASITIAQGLLESNAGDSRLATNENNHFGIKCHSKCIGCKCANYTDDSKYDMFRIFKTPWYSFRAHSDLLTGSRYKHLLQLSKHDYKNWAHGLQAAGYATDPAYGNKLIRIIEAFELHKLDVKA